MAFGQQSGPPASAKQVQYLESLLKKAGHGSFREARGPLGLTQRQGNGKFTTQEASDLISRLVDEASDDAAPPDPAPPSPARSSGPLAAFPADVLAAELERRGWTVSPPGSR